MAQMIPKIIDPVETSWQKELAEVFTDPAVFLQYLGFDPVEFAADIQARRLFPMRVPRPFAARMVKGDRNDPLFRQVFTATEEFLAAPGFSTDPLEEQESAVPGVLHKYQSRVLMIVRGGCAVNCRYCFRRHFPYGDNTPSRAGWQQALDYIAADERIDEVIYSGGDPLMAKDEFLAWLTRSIEAIPHVRRVRIHTRLPVVIPTRITDELLDWFTTSRLKPVMVVHINHAKEIDEQVKAAMHKLRQAGVTLLNQAVLLRGINDTAEDQVALSEALFNAGVLPYYLHLLDKVRGAAHFEVLESEAREIMAEVIRHLPGYLVPKLVREIGNQPGKTPIDLHLP
ncbi:EF-P beta-lysylation protein EpmB [Aliiglaciecola sp. CAU 1673]|uniref:EF-P beta-lysylation protein EpmB n=1 Tax=Aliiglaciecola sp. CAU 1673 TaxID=3032595 RepID=UPI0023DA9DA8|nr:EF-P beta-lysylation protein EpmB [Aliiglaciecola sp. CAU 1673]MDF2177911.1 EF-P beta-lysylation protein EpmB [Aliiglaciecola sp. CAU 1673]